MLFLPIGYIKQCRNPQRDRRRREFNRTRWQQARMQRMPVRRWQMRRIIFTVLNDAILVAQTIYRCYHVQHNNITISAYCKHAYCFISTGQWHSCGWWLQLQSRGWFGVDHIVWCAGTKWTVAGMVKHGGKRVCTSRDTFKILCRELKPHIEEQAAYMRVPVRIEKSCCDSLEVSHKYRISYPFSSLWHWTVHSCCRCSFGHPRWPILSSVAMADEAISGNCS